MIGEIAGSIDAREPGLRPGLLVIVDNCTEGPPPDVFAEPARELASSLGVTRDQIIVLNQNWRSLIGRPTPDSPDGPRLNWAFADGFSLNARHLVPGALDIPTVRACVERRSFRKHFICLNALVRPHRVALFALLRQRGLLDKTYLSFKPESVMKVGFTAPSFDEVAREAEARFPFARREIQDLQQRWDRQPLVVDDVPTDASQFDLVPTMPIVATADSLFSIVTETGTSDGTVLRYTEKTLKPILAGRPFIVVGEPHVLRLLRSLGFRTFDGIIDESYDAIESRADRLHAIVTELERLSHLELDRWSSMLARIDEICLDNQHFAHSEAFARVVLERFRSTFAVALGRAREAWDPSQVARSGTGPL
jgi:hypothetical protein